MQNDLISRDFSVKALREYADQKHAVGETELANGILKAVCFLQKEENVPIAYDVGKVVEDVRVDLCSMGFDESKVEIIVADIRNGGKE